MMRLFRSFSFIGVAVAGALVAAQGPANSDAAAAYQSGRMAMEKGDLRAARSAFEKAVRLNPGSADAQNMLGQVLLGQGDVDGAIVHFRTVVRLRPKLAIAHAYLGQAFEAK